MAGSDLYKEKQLFSMIAEGSEKAFNEFYATLLPDFTDYIFKMVKSEEGVKEVVQEALVRLWLYRDKLDDVEQPRPWFFKIVSNECFRYLRKHGLQQRRMEWVDIPVANLDDRSVHQTELDISLRETQRIILETVAMLSPRQRTIYKMSREQGMTLPEIAQELGVSRDYVKKTLMRALQIIRQKLIDAGQFLAAIILILK